MFVRISFVNCPLPFCPLLPEGGLKCHSANNMSFGAIIKMITRFCIRHLILYQMHLTLTTYLRGRHHYSPHSEVADLRLETLQNALRVTQLGNVTAGLNLLHLYSLIKGGLDLKKKKKTPSKSVAMINSDSAYKVPS